MIQRVNGVQQIELRRILSQIDARGLTSVPLGAGRVASASDISAAQALMRARGKPAVLGSLGPKGNTGGGLGQLLFAPQLRPLLREIDIVFLVRHPLRDWQRSLTPLSVHPRVDGPDVKILGMAEDNLLLEIDGVSLRVMDETTLAKEANNILARPSILVDYPDDNMDQLVPYLQFFQHILKCQVIKGTAETVDGITYDPKKPKVIQSRLREDDITGKEGRIITSLSCTTTWAAAIIEVLNQILGLEAVLLGQILGTHTFTSEAGIPFADFLSVSSTGSAKSTGLCFPGIPGWENFDGKVNRMHFRQPSVAHLQLFASFNHLLPADEFDLALHRVALERPDLIGLVNPEGNPLKEKFHAGFIDEAPHRSIMLGNSFRLFGQNELHSVLTKLAAARPDLAHLAHAVRFGGNVAFVMALNGFYNNVTGFSLTMLEGIMRIFKQRGIGVETNVMEHFPTRLPVMGPDELSRVMRKKEAVIAEKRGRPQVDVPVQLAPQPIEDEAGLTPLYPIGNFPSKPAPGVVPISYDEADLHLLDQGLGHLLKGLHLALVDVEERPLVPEPRNTKTDPNGFIQQELSPLLTLLSALGTLGPAFFARGGLAAKRGADAKRLKIPYKHKADRAASSIIGWGFDVLARYASQRLGKNVVFLVSQSEGARPKVQFGETGGNPSPYEGQLFGTPELTSRALHDLEKDPNVVVYKIVIDAVDKTTGTVEGLHNAVTAFMLTASPKVRPLVDLRALKIVGGKGLPGITDVDAPPEVVAKAIATASGVSVDQLVLANLVLGREKRLGVPTNAMRKLGVTFIPDADGDVIPAIAAGLGMHPTYLGQPLHGMAAAAGGTPEAGLLLPVEWLGGSVLLGLCSQSGFKTWETRRNYPPMEIKKIVTSGYDPMGSFGMADIFSEPFADGAAAFGGITNNHNVPELTGTRILNKHRDGFDGVEISGLGILSDGRAGVTTYRLAFTGQNGKATTRDATLPYFQYLRELPENRIPGRITAWLRDERDLGFAARLQRETGFEAFPLFPEPDPTRPFAGFELDWHLFDTFSGPGARYDARDRRIFEALLAQAPWIGATISKPEDGNSTPNDWDPSAQYDLYNDI